jgi:parallel beta-helix repeat protein
MNMKKQLKMLFILLTIAFSVFNFANRTSFTTVNATYVEGPITQDTIWTLVDSPFVVSKNVTVYSSATLTIEPGVEVKFGGNLSLIISGKLYANGTSKTITFTSNKMQPKVGDWQAIVFNGAQKSILIGCSISYAKYGMFIENGNVEAKDSSIGLSQNGITATSSTLLVYNCTVSSCAQSGIDITDSRCTIQKSTIKENQENGISVTENEQVIIQENEVTANGNGILLTGSESSNVNISRNIINANEKAAIRIDADGHSNMTILYNQITSNVEDGLYISTSSSTLITNNSISYNGIGIFYDKGNHEAHLNDIYGNDVGMDVASDATVNAERNYWGDPSGPYHESLNPEGRGNSVGGNGVNLDFIFFLAKSIGYINTRPTAILLVDKLSVLPDEDVIFFATNSNDSDGRVDEYLFDFGDGSNSGWTTLSIFMHKYSSPSPPEGYNVTLTVMDDYGTTSDSVITPIIVQNLPSLQVTVDLNSSKVHEGEQVSVTVHVTNGTAALENATVTLFSVKNGAFTASSGLTEENGNFTTTFTAPALTKVASIRIIARASKAGYTDGSDYEYLEVLPFLSVQVTANPDTIKSEGTTQVLIYVSCNGETVSNASVTILSSSGSLSSETAVTNSSGSVSLVFTAPQTTTFLNVTITATATKGNYMDGVGQTRITIEPKILAVQIIAEPNVTISEANINVTVHVGYDTPIAGANITIAAENGNFSTVTGLTDNDGNVTFSFIAPQVNEQSNISITARATKAKYAEGQGQLKITVNPRTFNIQISTSSVESGESADVTVNVTCKEDATPVTGAMVTILSSNGSFSITTKTTSPTGICTFIFNAPQTTAQLSITITANVTKNGYADGGNQTVITVNPKTAPQGEGGWPITTILLIIIPIIIAVVVVILIKLKIIVLSAEEEE